MAIPRSRSEFKAFCLRALGDGVLQINCSDDQVEDRIDEAFYMYQQFHMDAVTKTWMKHQVTASTLWFSPGTLTGTMRIGDTLTGNISGATIFVDDISSNGTGVFVRCHTGGSHPGVMPDDTSFDDSALAPGLLSGELVTGYRSGATAILANTMIPILTVTNTTGYLVGEIVTETVDSIVVGSATIAAIADNTRLVLSSVTANGFVSGSNAVGSTSLTTSLVSDFEMTGFFTL